MVNLIYSLILKNKKVKKNMKYYIICEYVCNGKRLELNEIKHDEWSYEGFNFSSLM